MTITKYKPMGGDEINQTIRHAILHAQATGTVVEFIFNGVTVQVASNSNPTLIHRDWQRGMLRTEGTFTVQPHPSPVLSGDDLAEDARLEAERDARLEAMRREYETKRAQKREQLQAALKSAPAMAFQDGGQEKWKTFKSNNQDPYGAAVARFAELWARLMQQRVTNGHTIAQCADECCTLADAEVGGITGYMYGGAVSVLAQVTASRVSSWRSTTSR